MNVNRTAKCIASTTATGALLAALAILSVSNSALATDLPSRKEAPYAMAPAPRFSWTGLYIGLNAGLTFNNTNGNSASSTGFPVLGGGVPALFSSGGGTGNAHILGGGQLGYNYQMGVLVAGVETDFQWMDFNNGNIGPRGNSQPGFANASLGSNGQETGYFGTVRGRLGYAIDQALFFVTGGYAYGSGGRGGTANYYSALNLTNVPDAVYSRDGGSTRSGYTLGAGLEYAMARNWTVKLEYLYVDLGDRNTTYLTTAPGFAGTTLVSDNRNNNRFNVVRAGLNYKF